MYTKEQYDKLPDEFKSDFVEVDGGYKHAGLVKVKQTADELNGKLSEATKRIEEIEAKQAEEIEKAKREALEKARSKGDVEAIEKRYQEQMADLEKRTAERVRGEVEKEYNLKAAKLQAETSVERIVSKMQPKSDAAAKLIRTYVAGLVKPNESGKVVYFNDDGSASSLDEAGFIKDLIKSGMFDDVRKADPTTVKVKGRASEQEGSARPGRFDKSARAAQIAERYNLKQ